MVFKIWGVWIGSQHFFEGFSKAGETFERFGIKKGQFHIKGCTARFQKIEALRSTPNDPGGAEWQADFCEGLGTIWWFLYVPRFEASDVAAWSGGGPDDPRRPKRSDGIVALTMASIEQAALDGNKWEVAWLLSDPPPGVFTTRPASSNPRLKTFAPLCPADWAATALSYVKELDIINTRRSEAIPNKKGKKEDDKEPGPKRPPCTPKKPNLLNFSSLDELLDLAEVSCLRRPAANWVRLFLLLYGGPLRWKDQAESWKHMHLSISATPFSARPFLQKTSPSFDFDATCGPVLGQTQAYRDKLDQFSSWLVSQGVSFDSLVHVPVPDVDTISILLEKYGRGLYASGKPYNHYAELTNGFAAKKPILRRQLQAAWDLAYSWLRVEPPIHHVALPWQALLPILATSISWGWIRVAAVIALSWGGRTRRGGLGSLSPDLQRGVDLGSLRAGGASWLLLVSENSELTRRRGRWLTAKTMEVYVQESASIQLVPRLPAEIKQQVLDGAESFPWLLSYAKILQQAKIPESVWYIICKGEAAKCIPQVGQSGNESGAQWPEMGASLLCGIAADCDLTHWQKATVMLRHSRYVGLQLEVAQRSVEVAKTIMFGHGEIGLQLEEAHKRIAMAALTEKAAEKGKLLREEAAQTANLEKQREREKKLREKVLHLREEVAQRSCEEAIGCRCTDGADGGTEASAEDDVVPISAISDTTVVKKEWNSREEVYAFIMTCIWLLHTYAFYRFLTCFGCLLDCNRLSQLRDKNSLEESRKKLVTCARALRARLAKEQADVWKKAEAEFNVQKMIWQSLSLQRGAKRHQGTAAMIESKLEFAMQSHTNNLTAAVALKRWTPVFNATKDGPVVMCLDLLGVAMIESIEAIKKSAAHADSRQELAALLDKAAEDENNKFLSND
eukprot:s2365_g5.t1